jgi:hypothetical protein
MRILVHLSRRISRVVTTCLVPRRLPAPSCTPLVHAAHLSIVNNHFIDIRTAVLTGREMSSIYPTAVRCRERHMDGRYGEAGRSFCAFTVCACVSRWLITTRYSIHSRLREKVASGFVHRCLNLGGGGVLNLHLNSKLPNPSRLTLSSWTVSRISNLVVVFNGPLGAPGSTPTRPLTPYAARQFRNKKRQPEQRTINLGREGKENIYSNFSYLLTCPFSISAYHININTHVDISLQSRLCIRRRRNSRDDKLSRSGYHDDR